MTFPPVFAIAEKPSQAKSYAAALNAKLHDFYYIVSPCKLFPQGMVIFSAVGHLLKLKEPHLYKGFEHLEDWKLDNLPFGIPKPYEYEPIKKTKNTLLSIKDAIRDIINHYGASNVTAINSCDIDVEGSAIFHTVLKYCISEEEYNQLIIKRLWLKSLEQKAVYIGFNNLLDDYKDKNMYKQGITRGAADWIVGLSTTRVLTIYVTSMLELLLNQRSNSGGPVLSVKDILGGTSLRSGRIILPVLHLIYNRENEINNFTEEKFFEVFANVTTDKGTYKGKLEGFKTFQRADVEDLLNRHSIKTSATAEVTSVLKELKHTSSKRLHSISSLQKYANKKWKMTAKSTLSTVQSLYETHKILTYPRSDCQYIGHSEFEYLLNNLEAYKETIGVQFENTNCEPRNRYVDPTRVEEHFAIIPTTKVPTQELLQKLTQNEYRIYMEVLRTTLAMFAPDYEYEQTTILTNINGLNFRTVGRIEKNLGFRTLWQDDKELEQEEKDVEDSAKIPDVIEGTVAKAKIEVKTGTTKPLERFTEATLLTAMETAGQYVDDEEDAEILKSVDGIGTGATRDGAIESLKEANYILLVKNKIFPTPKAFIACKATEGTLLSSPTMTAKWEKYLKQIGDGLKSPAPFLDSIDKFIERFLSTIPDVISRTETVNYFNHLIDRVEESTKSYLCPKCKKGYIKGIITPKGSFYGCSNFRNEDIKCNLNIPSEYRKRKISLANIKTLIDKGKTPVLKFKSKEGKEYTGRLIMDLNTFKLTFEYENKIKKK
ncbi:type IA DNA topoisomerase [Lysinibacillus fusiformis]|uniref:type IA DNA topoisomerase n=1 Tax=Lysinibacillus fusiformis TaxID=28031 RepID=UPI0018830CD2|nr:type IA DNA topoisomerase [Lysinibacillus fusiformis]MBD8523902.1 hypothetical protein [Lysinibacillus fusiformis]